MSTEDRKRVAALRLRARRHRDGELRRRAIILSLLMFAMLWAAVFAQMVSGHDPVLGAGTKAASVARQDPQQTAKRQSQAAGDDGGASADPENGSVDGPTAAPGTATTSVAPAPAAPAVPAAPAAPAPAAPAPVITSQS